MNKQTSWQVFMVAFLLAAVLPHRAEAADITVDGSICTLVDAITAANTDTATGGCPAGDSGADTITLETNVTLAEAVPEISSTMTIEGGGFTINGDNGNFSVLKVSGAGNLTMNEVTVTGGIGTLKSSDSTNSFGGGIYNEGGTITLTNCTINGNTAFVGGGIYNESGTLTLTSTIVSKNTTAAFAGGIYNNGTVTLTNCTISENSSHSGGGVYNSDMLALTSTTINGNHAVYGGGIMNGGTAMLINSTISGNTAASGGGLYNANTATLISTTVSGNTADNTGTGGGIRNNYNGTLTLQSSIISGNMDADNEGNEVTDYSSITAASFNLFGHSSESNAQAFSGFTPGSSDVNAASDGDRPTALASILNTTLADKGGPTQTHALIAGSPAIDLDAACSAGLTKDQRGEPRPSSGCDAGAFEYNGTVPNSKKANLIPVYKLLLK